MRKVCVLVSGGVESAALICHYLQLGYVIFPVYIRCGFDWENAEIFWLKKLLGSIANNHLQPITFLDSPVRGVLEDDHWSLAGPVPDSSSLDKLMYIPGRNLVLLNAASIFCSRRGIKVIALGTLKGNPFPDASLEFFRQMQKVLSEGLDYPLRIQTPFRNKTKKQVVRGLTWSYLNLTFSCVSPIKYCPCGKCNKCEERRKVTSL